MSHVLKSSIGQPARCLIFESLESRACPAGYSIVDLLPPAEPAGLDSSIALGLNELGVVVGRTVVGGYGRAATWEVTTGSTAVGTLLPVLAGGVSSEANDVNSAGMISGFSTVDANGYDHAVVWVKDGGGYLPHDLGGATGSSSNVEARALSDPDPNGVTWVAGVANSHATVWRVDGAGNVLQTIDLAPDSVYSFAHDVRLVDPNQNVSSDEYILVSGEVQLTLPPQPAGQPAAVWKLGLNGQVLSRTDVGTLGGYAARGFAINGQGHVAGQSQPSGRGSALAFISASGSMTSLGTLTNGGSSAEGLNDHDVAVGRCDILSKSGALQSSKAFVWQSGAMLDLRKQLSTKDQSNWPTLFGAYDINAKGQIVGNGAVGKGSAGQGHGFLMKPITPPANTASTEVVLLLTTPSSGTMLTTPVDPVRPTRGELFSAVTRDLACLLGDDGHDDAVALSEMRATKGRANDVEADYVAAVDQLFGDM